jgi:hypothetical protein
VIPSPLAPLQGSQSKSTSSRLAYTAGHAIGQAARAPWTTPRRLLAFRTATWVLAGLLLFAGETTLNRSRSSLQTIAKDTAPSIISAEEIGTALADLDANVANALLGTLAHRLAAEAAIEKQRVAATNGLVKSAEHITNGDAERGPLGAMILDLGRYLEKAAEAELLHARGDDAGARDAYWIATDLLHKKLLAAADQLDLSKKEQMDVAFANEIEENDAAEVVAAGFGGLLLGTLLWAQWFLFKRMRRMFNVPLLVATFAALGLTAYLIHAFSDTRKNLRVAKQDAFDSIYALVRARVLAYDANGDESRFLLDPTPFHGMENEFRRKVQRLTEEPVMSKKVTAQLAKANPKTRGPRPADLPTVKGILWDELRNITFPGEYDSAANMVTAFARYCAIDDQMRKAKSAGKDAEAIELAIGTKADDTNAALEQFDQALGRTLDINQAAFDQAVLQAQFELKRAEILDPGLTLLIVLCAWLGVRQRLKEYAA